MTDFQHTKEDLFIYILQIQQSSGQLYWRKPTPSFMDAMRLFIVDLQPKHYKISPGESFKVFPSPVRTDYSHIRCDYNRILRTNELEARMYIISKEVQIGLDVMKTHGLLFWTW